MEKVIILEIFFRPSSIGAYIKFIINIFNALVNVNMKNQLFNFKVVLFMGFLMIACHNPQRDLYPETLVGGFELLPSEITGIDFNNKINETKFFNHYFYSQIYLGSGVAIGDLNNDGLPDIFFGGNQVSDRLYLNKGNFQSLALLTHSKIKTKHALCIILGRCVMLRM